MASGARPDARLLGLPALGEDWTPDLRRPTRAFVAHGREDPIMEVGFARSARDLLEAAGVEVEYHESDAAHRIDPAHVRSAVSWLSGTLG